MGLIASLVLINANIAWRMASVRLDGPGLVSPGHDRLGELCRPAPVRECRRQRPKIGAEDVIVGHRERRQVPKAVHR
jgi:hypothetical protein